MWRNCDEFEAVLHRWRLIQYIWIYSQSTKAAFHIQISYFINQQRIWSGAAQMAAYIFGFVPKVQRRLFIFRYLVLFQCRWAIFLAIFAVPFTGPGNNIFTWFCKVCCCFCLLACSILTTMYKYYFPAQYRAWKNGFQNVVKKDTSRAKQKS